MFATIRAMFRRKPAAPAMQPMQDDIPAHKGFRVVAKYEGRVLADNVSPTLEAARQAASHERACNASWKAGLAAHGFISKARHHVFIQNLETGRLCA